MIQELLQDIHAHHTRVKKELHISAQKELSENVYPILESLATELQILEDRLDEETGFDDELVERIKAYLENAAWLSQVVLGQLHGDPRQVSTVAQALMVGAEQLYPELDSMGSDEEAEEAEEDEEDEEDSTEDSVDKEEDEDAAE